MDGVSARPRSPESRAGGAARRERVRVWLLQVVSVVAALATWEAVARAGWVDPLFVAPPSAVATALVAIAPTAFAALADTLGKTALAYAIAVGVGVPAGLVIGSVRVVHDVAHPFVVALYGIPKILVLPWIVLLLGFGTAPAVAYGAIHGLFPILVMVIGGVRDVDGTLVTVARAYGARPWQVYGKVILPASVPAVLASLRLGIVFCLLGVLIVEMFAGVRGMGYVLGAFANGFQAAQLFAATALVSVASIAIVLGLDHLSERLSHWRG